MTNSDVAAAFDEIADWLLLKGESWFKVRAYRQGAGAVRTAAEPIADLSADGRLAKLPHVGKAITEKTAALLTTGTIPLLERLRGELPRGLLELVHGGLPPAIVRRLYREFGVDGPAALRSAVAMGRFAGDPELLAALGLAAIGGAS